MKLKDIGMFTNLATYIVFIPLTVGIYMACLCKSDMPLDETIKITKEVYES